MRPFNTQKYWLIARYEFETYKKFSLSFYTVLMGYADELQAVSVDEALVDATSAVAARANAPEEAEHETYYNANLAEEEREDRDDAGPDTERDLALPPKKRDPAVEIAEKIRDEVRRDTGCEGMPSSPSYPRFRP